MLPHLLFHPRINRLPTEPKFSRQCCNPCAVCGRGAEFAYLLIGQDGLPADILVLACLLAMELPPAGVPDLKPFQIGQPPR